MNTDEKKPKSRRLTIILLIAGGVLLLLTGVALLFLLRTDGGGLPAIFASPTPTLIPDLQAEITPPPSLSELAEDYPEIASILTDPELASVYKEFLVAFQEGGTEAAYELAQERGLLTPDGESLRVTLVLDTEDHDPLIAQLESVGVEVVSAYQDRVNIAVPVALVEEAMESEDTEIIFGQLTELDHVIAVRLPEQRDTNQRGVEGEGVGVIQADAWHAAGFTGEGLRIGVLDLGFAGHEELLGEDLPENVPLKTFGWYDESEVHGTACAEIVHEVAPGAELVFAWYDGADASFGEAVEWLLAQDVDIITHSAGGVISPRDGTGWDAQVVDEVVAKGILWVNSAGNEADVHHRGTFTDTDGDGYHEFAPGEEMLAVYMWNYLRIYLLWDDNWTRPTQDYDLLIVDEDQNILARADDAQDGSEGQRPAEWVGIESDESVIYLMVQVYESDRPVTFDLFVSGPSAEIVAAVPQYSVTAPGDATGALTVGATEWDDDSLAYYSSQGPTNDERLKPEISAPAGVSGATYGPREFDGTSASTPHVAGAAALVWQAHPEFSRQQVVDFLISASRDLGPTGPDTGYGYGRLLLPPPGDEVIPPVTPGPGPSTTTPSPEVPVTPTSVAFVTPQPTTVLEDDDDEDGGVSLALIGLLIGGMGLGGMGLLLVSGLLFIRSRRAHQTTARPRSPYPPPPPPPSPQRGAGPPDATPPWREPTPRPEPPVPLPPTRRAPPPPEPARCPECGARLREGARFCAACGHSLAPARQPRFCRHCGAQLRPGSEFCPKCGERV